jgi:hypothetical protein
MAWHAHTMTAFAKKASKPSSAPAHCRLLAGAFSSLATAARKPLIALPAGAPAGSFSGPLDSVVSPLHACTMQWAVQ